MKKSIILAMLLVPGVGLTFFFTIDFWMKRKLSDIAMSFHSDEPKKDSELLDLSKEPYTGIKDEDKISESKPQRIFKPALQVVSTFPFQDGSVYKWISRQGKIYVQDPYTQQVLELDDHGKLLTIYGAKGGAPWEHEGIMSFEVNNGELYTADNNKMVIKRGRLGDKKLVYHQKIKETFWDAALLHDDLHIVFMEDQNENVGDFSFHVYDARKNQFYGKTSFRDLLKIDKSIQYLDIAYGGHFIRNENGNLLFVCSRAGLFIAFDDAGKVRYTAETIDQSPPPKVTLKKTGRFTMFVKEPDLNRNYSSTADSSTLYILSCVRFKKVNNLVVDMYRISDGAYQGSVEIPNNEDTLPSDILITPEGKLWVIYESMNIVIYQLNS